MTVFDLMGYNIDLKYSDTASKTDLVFALVYVAAPSPGATFKPIVIFF